ncbi:unnamed protein product, partial [Mesorhabditis spiculigera]
MLLTSATGALKGFAPLFDRVLVERVAAEVKTKGGIMLPENSKAKILEATVVAAGPGARKENGDTIPMNVKVGDRVLLPEYGGSKVIIDDKEFTILREGDLLGKFD